MFLTFENVTKVSILKKNTENFFSIFITLIISLIAIGFGSTSGIQGKLGLGSVFFSAVFIILVFFRVQNQQQRSSIILMFGIYLLSLIIIVFIGSAHNPYRSDDLAKMSRETIIGNHKSNILLTDSASKQIENLRKSAFASGFTVSTPTINLVYPSGVGFGYALGGRQSPTIHFVWFGYPETLRQSLYLFSVSEKRFDFRNAWILKSPDLSYGVEKPVLEDLLGDIESRSLRRFPSGYSLIYKDAELELWKPHF
jgi:hypothetical protein